MEFELNYYKNSNGFIAISAIDCNGQPYNRARGEDNKKDLF